MRSLLVLFVLLAAPALFGCSKWQRERECQSLITRINQSVDELYAKPLSEDRDVATVVKEARQLSSGYRSLSFDLASLNLETPELRSFAKEYQAMASNASDTLQDVAQAVERMDAQTAKHKKATFADIAQREDKLMQKIESFCHPQD